MKTIIFATILMTLGNSYALECVSTSEKEHHLKLKKQMGTNEFLLEQFHEGKIISTHLGTIIPSSGSFTSLTTTYEFFNALGENSLLEINQSFGLPTCRAAVCPGSDSNYTAKWSGLSDYNEYFKCL